jgi:hypothetical protein
MVFWRGFLGQTEKKVKYFEKIAKKASTFWFEKRCVL